MLGLASPAVARQIFGFWWMKIVGTLLKRSREGSQGTAFPSLSVPHRLAILYLMTPLVVWLVGWFQWWFGIPAAALLALGLWQALSGSWRVSLRPIHLVLLLIAAGWVMVTAAGGVFDVHNFDWFKHRGILLDLSNGSWPTYLPTYIDAPVLLRYYIGYYMVPGLLSNLFGLATLNWAVPLWTWCGVALMLILFTREHRGWTAILAALILVFFSGMDIVRIALFEGLDWLEVSVDLQGWPRIWLGERDSWAGTMGLVLHYSPHMGGMMWVPQHFIAGVLYVLLLVQLFREPRFLAVSGVLLAESLLVAICGDWVATDGRGIGYCEWYAATLKVAKPMSSTSDSWIDRGIPGQWVRCFISIWLGLGHL